MKFNHKNQIHGLKITKSISKLSKRPQSATSRPNGRDPQWMKLFHPSIQKIDLHSKISSLTQYNTRPQGPIIEIQPKFSVNAINLYKVLKNSPSIENLKTKKLNFKYNPDTYAFTERNDSLSRISSVRNEKIFSLSRPSTANIRNQGSLRKNVNVEFLPDKGHEFVTEVIKIWNKMDQKNHFYEKNEKKPESFDIWQEEIEEELVEELVKPKKTVVLKVPRPVSDTREIGYQLSPKFISQNFGNNNFKLKTSRTNSKKEFVSISIQAEAKVLTERPIIKTKYLNADSKSLRFFDSKIINH